MGLRTLLVVDSLLLISTSVHAQYNGAIKGSVTDPNGAIVTDAKVTVTSTFYDGAVAQSSRSHTELRIAGSI